MSILPAVEVVRLELEELIPITHSGRSEWTGLDLELRRTGESWDGAVGRLHGHWREIPFSLEHNGNNLELLGVVPDELPSFMGGTLFLEVTIEENELGVWGEISGQAKAKWERLQKEDRFSYNSLLMKMKHKVSQGITPWPHSLGTGELLGVEQEQGDDLPQRPFLGRVEEVLKVKASPSPERLKLLQESLNTEITGAGDPWDRVKDLQGTPRWERWNSILLYRGLKTLWADGKDREEEQARRALKVLLKNSYGIRGAPLVNGNLDQLELLAALYVKALQEAGVETSARGLARSLLWREARKQLKGHPVEGALLQISPEAYRGELLAAIPKGGDFQQSMLKGVNNEGEALPSILSDPDSGDFLWRDESTLIDLSVGPMKGSHRPYAGSIGVFHGGTWWSMPAHGERNHQSAMMWETARHSDAHAAAAPGKSFGVNTTRLGPWKGFTRSLSFGRYNELESGERLEDASGHRTPGVWKGEGDMNLLLVTVDRHFGHKQRQRVWQWAMPKVKRDAVNIQERKVTIKGPGDWNLSIWALMPQPKPWEIKKQGDGLLIRHLLDHEEEEEKSSTLNLQEDMEEEFSLEEGGDGAPNPVFAKDSERLQEKFYQQTSSVKMGTPRRGTKAKQHSVVVMAWHKGPAPTLKVPKASAQELCSVGGVKVTYLEHELIFGESNMALREVKR